MYRLQRYSLEARTSGDLYTWKEARGANESRPRHRRSATTLAFSAPSFSRALEASNRVTPYVRGAP